MMNGVWVVTEDGKVQFIQGFGTARGTGCFALCGFWGEDCIITISRHKTEEVAEKQRDDLIGFMMTGIVIESTTTYVNGQTETRYAPCVYDVRKRKIEE